LRLLNPLWVNATERDQFLSQLPDLTPHPTGAHMLAAWNWARMKVLFWPWQPQNIAAARKLDAPAPVRLHAEVVEILRAGTLFAPLWRAALADTALAAPTNFAGPISVHCDDEPERVRITSRMVAALGLTEMTGSADKQLLPGVRTWQKH
jgi:hypothetical protein